MENQTIEIEDTICPTCKKVVTGEEADFVHDIGECGSCDHVRGDINDIADETELDDDAE